MKKILKYWLFSLALSLAAAGMYTIVNNYYANKYSEVEPEITISAEDLADAYSDNANTADSTYKNKVAEITGTISTIGGNTTIYTVNFDGGIYSVNCNFDDPDEINKLLDYSPGDEITIIGKIEGIYLVYISVGDCEIK